MSEQQKKRDRLSEALNNTAIEIINENLQSSIDQLDIINKSIDVLPSRLSLALDEQLKKIIDAAELSQLQIAELQKKNVELIEKNINETQNKLLSKLILEIESKQKIKKRSWFIIPLLVLSLSSIAFSIGQYIHLKDKVTFANAVLKAQEITLTEILNHKEQMDFDVKFKYNIKKITEN